MKGVNTTKLVVPRERGALRADSDQSGNVPPGPRQTQTVAAPSPPPTKSGMTENAWLRGVTVL
jgi:hypothetical protein